MRIGIFGNTNNYPLQLALALRALGHEAMLVVNRREPLHRPESRFPELARRYPDWILDCADIPEEEFLVGGLRLHGVLNFLAGGSGGLVLNDLGPSLLQFCPLPAVAFMTGSDLTGYANPDLLRARTADWSEDYAASPGGQLVQRRLREFVDRQRRGVRTARAVSAPPRGVVPVMDTILDGLGVPDTRREFFYFADPILRPVPPVAGRRGLRVVNAARLNWVRPMPPGFCTQDHKGTDVLLHGAAAHVAAGRRLTLVLFRKGLHVAETEALVRELGLAPHVEWQDEVGLHAFHRALAEADVVCDQFGESFPGMSTLDALAMGRPVVASVHPRIQQGLFAEPWPVRHAATPAEVAAHLAALADPDARARAGAASAAFASRHLSPLRAAQVCLGYFGEAHAARVTGAA